jgi:hypothetical protein
MPYTGLDVFDRAIAIIDELSDTGVIVESQIKEYKYRAPFLLDLWQQEIAGIENLTDVEPYIDLEQELIVSDKGCASAPYYLAMHFAASDQNSEIKEDCKHMYEKLKREARLPINPVKITDVYSNTNI